MAVKKQVSERRCPSRHRDAYDYRYILWCPECGGVRPKYGNGNLLWQYPRRGDQ